MRNKFGSTTMLLTTSVPPVWMSEAQGLVMTKVSVSSKPPPTTSSPSRTSSTPVPPLVTTTAPLSSARRLSHAGDDAPIRRFVDWMEPPLITTELLEPKLPMVSESHRQVPPSAIWTVLLLLSMVPVLLITVPPAASRLGPIRRLFQAPFSPTYRVTLLHSEPPATNTLLLVAPLRPMQLPPQIPLALKTVPPLLITRLLPEPVRPTIRSAALLQVE